jgi:CheY-like chemotaxis protein
MRVVIAEDDPLSRRILEATLEGRGYDVVVTSDGLQAWNVIRRHDGPALAVLDWMMPRMDGVEICRRLRASPASNSLYIILLTSRTSREDVVAGLDAGADDYIAKPFDPDELRARLRVGARVLDLQVSLAERVRELEEALAQVSQLRALLPICAYCKKIRNDRDYWEQIETYVMKHSGARFSHGICPECFTKYAEPELERAAHDVTHALEPKRRSSR